MGVRRVPAARTLRRARLDIHLLQISEQHQGRTKKKLTGQGWIFLQLPCQLTCCSLIPSPNMSSLFGNASTLSTTSAASTIGDLKNDYTLTSPPEDGISDIRFSPQSEHLAVASWDKKVRIYEINANGGSEGKAMFEHEGPVLACCWSKVNELLCFSIDPLLTTYRTVDRSSELAPTRQHV